MIEIRIMQEKDIEQVTKLEQLIFSNPWSYQSIYESFVRPEYIFLVAIDQEKIIGYVGLYIVLSEGDITNIAVLPEYRNKGIAKLLLNRLFIEAAQKIKVMHSDKLLNTVEEANQSELLSNIGKEAVWPDVLLKSTDNDMLLEQINLEVRESNKAAIYLYKSLGFEVIGIRKNFYDKPKENAILMTYLC